MSGDLHDLSLLIGGLQADIKNLANEVREHKTETTEEHRKVHNIVDAMSEAVRNLTHIVAEMKPLTDDYREKRAEARGVKRMLILVYTAAGAGIVKALDWVLSLIPVRHP
jgi:chromosome segregation ATPase